MEPTSIKFNNFNLQTSTYRTKNIIFRQLAEKKIDSKPDIRRGGFDIIDTYYTQKQIEIDGWILADSKENLKIAINALKKALLPQEKNLDIEYGTDFTRYNATVQSMRVAEEHYHITRIPFDIVFLALPWSTDSNSITDSKSITSTTYTNSINITGSFNPVPILKWTVVGTPSAAITKIKFKNQTTDTFIEVEGLSLSSNGQYLEIDIDNMTVKQNSTNSDFNGVFPVFSPATNNYETTLTGTGFTLTQTINYYPTYL